MLLKRILSACWCWVRLMIVVSVICLTAFGCASTPEPTTIYRTVTEYRDRPVPVDARLTRALSPPIDVPARKWAHCPALVIHYRQRWESCEYRMGVIRDTHSALPGVPEYLIRPAGAAD